MKEHPDYYSMDEETCPICQSRYDSCYREWDDIFEMYMCPDCLDQLEVDRDEEDEHLFI